MTPDDYCRQKAAQSGSSFYYSFLFLPPERRRAITALYAFCREVDDIVDEPLDPGIAQAKLAWWRGEIGALFGATPQHPVTRALKPVVARFDLPEAHFQTVIDGMTMDLERSRYADFAELERYCDRVAGVVGLMSAEIFGYANPRTRDYARDLGIAFQLTNIVRDVGEDARRGRIYLPQDDLARHGVSTSALLEGASSPGFRPLIAEQIARARTWYARAAAKLPAEDRIAQRPGLIMAAIYGALLDEIARDGYRVLDHRIALTPLRKLWIAWKTARRSA
jgi:phytoene synthase